MRWFVFNFFKQCSYSTVKSFIKDLRVYNTSMPVNQSRLTAVILQSLNQIKCLKTMYNLIGFLSLQLFIILLLCIFDIYLQNMLTLDQHDKEIKRDELNADNRSLI